MKRQLLPLLLAIVLVLCSCTPSRTTRKEATESSTENGIHETFKTSTNSSSELNVWILDTTYAELGEYYGFPSLEENYIEKALQSYSQKNNVNIRIYYGNHQASATDNADLIILGSGADLQYHLSDENYLDLTTYFEQDQIYSSGQYIEPVLKAGLQNEQQLAFPLIFNMYALYTSQESLDRHKFPLTQNASFQDMINLFTNELNNLSRPTDEALLMGFEGLPSLSSVYHFFSFAGGTSFVDSETEKASLDPEYFNKMLALYEAYICNNFDCDRSSFSQLDSNISSAYWASDQSKWYRFDTLSDPYYGDGFTGIADQTACFLEITQFSDACRFSSFISQAAYYESRYRDLNEEFICIGVPEYEHSDSYAAQVTLCGLIPTNSNHPAESYRLLKYLADAPVPWYLGATVNRESISATLTTLTTTTTELTSYEIDPYQVTPMNQETDSYQMQSMSQETADYLLNMINQIHTVYLPMNSLHTNIEDQMISYLSKPDMSPEELYTKMIQAIQLYLFQM